MKAENANWPGAAALLAISLSAGGCTPVLRPVFEEPPSAVVWPPAPTPPRIRYVGQLTSAADLKPPPKPFQALTDLLVGARPAQPMYGPRSVVRTPDGRRLWVADPGGRCLHRLDLEDRSYVKVDRAGKALLLTPVDVCLGPEGSIFVCDSQGAAIYRLDGGSGALLATLRLPEDIQRPVALHYRDDRGELYVVDAAAHNIKVLGSDGRLLRILGKRGDGPGELNFPCAITGDAERIWVADSGNHRVQALTPTGEPIAQFGRAGDAPGDLALPKGVACDAQGHVYVVDARFENVQVFDRQGRLLLAFGHEGTGPGEFWLPSGIFIDAGNRIWVCDSYNGRVQVFDYVGGAEVTMEERP